MHDAFIDGAYFIYGHTIAQRTLGFGYQSKLVQNHFSTRGERNAFYTQLGRQVEPGLTSSHEIEQIWP